MAKDAVLAMSRLLPEDAGSRSRHFEEMLGLVRQVNLSAADATELAQQLLVGSAAFLPEEIRQLQLALQPDLQLQAGQAVAKEAEAKRRQTQDFCRVDKWLTAQQWQGLLIPACFRERADLLCEYGFLLGCRLPNEHTMGYWTALLSLMTKETSSYALHCNLQTVRSSWKAVSKRLVKIQPADAELLPLMRALPIHASGFSEHVSRPQPVAVEQRPFTEAELVTLACRVPLRKSHGSITTLRSIGSSGAVNTGSDGLPQMLRMLTDVLRSSQQEEALPGLKIFTGDRRARSGTPSICPNPSQLALPSSARAADLEAQLKGKAAGKDAAPETLLEDGRVPCDSHASGSAWPRTEASAPIADALIDVEAEVAGEAKLASAGGSLKQEADAIESHLRSSAAQKKVLKRPASACGKALKRPAGTVLKRPGCSQPKKDAANQCGGLRVDRKNRASRAYHAARKAALARGCTEAQALEAARKAHRAVK